MREQQKHPKIDKSKVSPPTLPFFLAKKVRLRPEFKEMWALMKGLTESGETLPLGNQVAMWQLQE